jgi:hypothetical protein
MSKQHWINEKALIRKTSRRAKKKKLYKHQKLFSWFFFPCGFISLWIWQIFHTFFFTLHWLFVGKMKKNEALKKKKSKNESIFRHQMTDGMFWWKSQMSKKKKKKTLTFTKLHLFDHFQRQRQESFFFHFA